MKKLLFILILSLLYNALFSKEIHVSVNGDDKNEGSSEKPFRTISQAAREAMPGDIIIVRSGIYREQIVPPRVGN
jgi:alpha-N-arabinofuranosidase